MLSCVLRALVVLVVTSVAAFADDKRCIDDGKPYDVKSLRARLTALAAPELDGRAPGTAGDKAARALIVDRFRCLGLAPAGDGDGYEQAFDKTANVVGFVKGSSKPDEIVVVGAHHDHMGGGLLGANDNASGVVGLLAIAQAVAQRETKPARTIAFVTFGAEEQGLVGSTYFLAHPPAKLPLAKVVQYINLDMIGSHASKRAVYAFGAFRRQPSAALLGKLARKFPKLSVGVGGHSVRGDHHGFCQQRIPYVFFWTPDARCYHQKCDTADKIDYPRLADIAALAGGLAIGLADSPRDLAKSKQKIGCFGR
jgi:hypothetical protein